ncbi:MAG: aromatic amino acid lyase, partial [Clostridium sp.]
RDIIENVQRVLATEIMAACQAIDFREGYDLGVGTKEAYEVVRENVDFIEKDVVMYVELDKVTKLIQDESILKRVEQKIKVLV